MSGLSRYALLRYVYTHVYFTYQGKTFFCCATDNCHFLGSLYSRHIHNFTITRALSHTPQTSAITLSPSLSVSFYPDMFEDMVSPVIAAQNLLTQACTKRKGVLDPVLAFCVSILQQPPEQRDYCKKDGALHVLGSVYEALMKKVLHYTVYLPLYVSHYDVQVLCLALCVSDSAQPAELPQ